MAVHGGGGLHHMHRRARANKRLDQYPHPNRWIRFLDKLLIAVALASPVMTLPQVFRIWTEKSAQGVSLTAWTFYLIVAFLWAAYGIVHKSKPIMITYSLFIFINAAIVAGILKYG